MIEVNTNSHNLEKDFGQLVLDNTYNFLHSVFPTESRFESVRPDELIFEPSIVKDREKIISIIPNIEISDSKITNLMRPSVFSSLSQDEEDEIEEPTAKVLTHCNGDVAIFANNIGIATKNESCK